MDQSAKKTIRVNYSNQRSISENSQNENREAEQRALISDVTDTLKPENKQQCPCASSCHVHQKTAYNQTTETCRLEPEREQNLNTNDSNSSHRSSTSEQRQSAQQECSINMPSTGSEFSIDSLGKKKIKSNKLCKKLYCIIAATCLVSIIVSIILSVIVSVCIYKYVIDTPPPQQVQNSSEVNTPISYASKTDGLNGKGGVSGQFYLDMDALEKDSLLVWSVDESKSIPRGILLLEDDKKNKNCFTVKEAGEFSISVALTFKYGLNTPDTGVTFYTVIKQQRQILKKNTISLFPEMMYQQSPANIVVELQPEERVCVWVDKPEFLFVSKVDNVMSIFKVDNAA